MSSEIDDFTRKLLERTRARQEAMKMKKMEQATQSRKRRPLEAQDNLTDNTSVQNLDPKESVIGSKNVSESPNKRSRMDDADDTENEPAISHKIEETHPAQPDHPRHLSVSERMKKIANQRKQWDAADHGEEVDFSAVLSPVRHEPTFPNPSATLQRKVDVERKARLAALANKVNSWEDDLTRTRFSPEKEDTKQVSATRRSPLVETTKDETHAKEDQADTPAQSNEVIRPVKNLSQRVSLSIETLSQFVGKDKQQTQRATDQQRTPVKIPTRIQGKLGGDRITVASCRVDESCNKVPSHQVTPTTKSLQQRLIELQKHGCKAEKTSGVSKAIADRQRELDALKNPPQIEEIDKVETDNDECMAVTTSADNSTASEYNEEEGCSITPEDNTSFDDASKHEEEDGCEDVSSASYGDSMMDGDDQVDEVEDVVQEEREEEENDSSREEQQIAQDDSVEDEDAMIDELFEGVDSDDEEEDEDLIRTSTSPLTIPSLTRQKSKLEIRTELTVRKQTCNEAEDTHMIERQPSRRLRPLARSNSSESVRSNEENRTDSSYPVFTIDAYRSEKRKSMRKANEKKVVRKENMVSRKAPRPVSSQERLSSLQEEVQQQQRVIQQASAALNCCYDAQHGKGSITELEAEKLLLIASEKRLALMDAIQELKAGKAKAPSSQTPPCNGSLTIDRIQLPLRTEYIFSMASKKDGGDSRSHYYFILVRCGPRRIFATHLASTHDSLSGDSLTFRDKFELKNLDSNFEINIEVYSKNHKSRADGVPNQEKSKSKFSGILHKLRQNAGPQCRSEEVMQLMRSFASKRKESSSDKSLTPRKPKHRSHALLAHAASPGGPNVIRISGFTLIGSTTLTLDDVNSDKFALQKVPFLSPLSGQLACRITSNVKSNVEQRGFLTMFDDVGGLGAWHRRWCALIHGVLYSWTYPDDEKYKTPLSKLELKECISETICTVERIRCARPNTFELRTMRPRRHGDRENLISQDTGSVITTKHWLAADTKEERVAWIESLNQALSDVRAWDRKALKPLKASS